jgi:hypothetical protein
MAALQIKFFQISMFFHCPEWLFLLFLKGMTGAYCLGTFWLSSSLEYSTRTNFRFSRKHLGGMKKHLRERHLLICPEHQ